MKNKNQKQKNKTKTKKGQKRSEIPIKWASENDKLTRGSKQAENETEAEAEVEAKVAVQVEAAKFRSCQTQLANKSAAECKGKFE